MFISVLEDILYTNGLLYISVLILIVASFLGAILASIFKSVQIFKNSYYSYLFEKDLWSQSLEKNIINANNLHNKSTVIKMFSEGFKLFVAQHEKSETYNSGSTIDLTKRTMKIILYKDLNYFSQGFNILSFNAVFIPYASLSLALWNILEVFNSVDIGILTLSMFIKPLTVLVLGISLAGISSVVYLVLQSKLESDERQALLFIDEFSSFLHRNFYNK